MLPMKSPTNATKNRLFVSFERRYPALLLVVVLLLLPGCSWLFVDRLPEDHHSHRDYDCTTSRTAPVVDTILTATNVASAIYVASLDNVKNKGPAVMLGLSVAAIWASSAVSGFHATSQCREAKEDDGVATGSLTEGRVAETRHGRAKSGGTGGLLAFPSRDETAQDEQTDAYTAQFAPGNDWWKPRPR